MIRFVFNHSRLPSLLSRFIVLTVLSHRRMMKIDVNKSGRIFDFLVSAGMLILSYDPTLKTLTPQKPGSLVGVQLGYGMDLMNGTSGMDIDGVVEIHPLNNGDAG